jgi:hypothetical protein
MLKLETLMRKGACKVKPRARAGAKVTDGSMAQLSSATTRAW